MAKKEEEIVFDEDEQDLLRELLLDLEQDPHGDVFKPMSTQFQQDVEELARVFTGWTLCKKADADVGDPLAPCLPNFWEDVGAWAPTYVPSRHDCDTRQICIVHGQGSPMTYTIEDLLYDRTRNNSAPTESDP